MARRLNPVAVADRRRQPFDREILLAQIDHDRLELLFSGSSSTTLPCFFKRLTVTSSSMRATTTWPLRVLSLCRRQIAASECRKCQRVDMPFTRNRKSALGLNRDGSTW